MGERVATLETQVRDLLCEVNGGNGVSWERSIRGRLHAMQSALASAELLAHAAEEIKQAQRATAHTLETARGRRWSRLTQTLLVLAAIATAAAPYVLHYTG